MEKLSANSDNSGSDSETVSSANVPNGHRKDFFNKVDTDGSNGISQDELKTLAENLNKMSGQNLDVSDEAFKGYDSDGDGSLNADELKSAMDKNGFRPPPPPGGMMAQSSSTDQSTGSNTYSWQDQLSELKTLLQALTKYSNSSESTYDSLLSITS